jgi:hypothetical protein
MMEAMSSHLTSGAQQAPERDDVVSDEELAALAMAADPHAPLDEDAVPISVYLSASSMRLPDWYMPPVMVRGCRRWRVPVVLGIVGAFLIIEAFGLCSTFGPLTLP